MAVASGGGGGGSSLGGRVGVGPGTGVLISGSFCGGGGGAFSATMVSSSASCWISSGVGGSMTGGEGSPSGGTSLEVPSETMVSSPDSPATPMSPSILFQLVPSGVSLTMKLVPRTNPIDELVRTA